MTPEDLTEEEKAERDCDPNTDTDDLNHRYDEEGNVDDDLEI